MTELVPAIAQLVTGLRSQILSGELGPGKPLNQNQLAGEFGLNRSQIREGLTVLAEERLVLMRPYATAVVAPLSIEEFDELHEIRMALEPMLSRMALQTLPRHLVLRMRQLVQDMEDTEDGATWLDANDEFHGLLYRQANRPWIVEIVDRARRLTARYTRVLIVDMNRRSQIGRVEHSDILDAIELRDSKLLETRLVDHMRSGHDIIVQHLAANPQLLTDQSHISGSDGGGRRIVR